MPDLAGAWQRTCRTFLVVVTLVATACGSQSVNLHLTPCTINGATARCGTFDVRESKATNRVLPLKVIVFPATDHNESAIFPFNGGPGVPTTPGAPDEVTIYAAERRLHDVVFVDERGTGESAPLRCANAMKVHARELVEVDLFPLDFVAECRREAAQNADLNAYGFPQFIDDIDALRRALGYSRIDIVGLSYGTRAALQYLQRYPQSVRSLLLIGPLVPENNVPLHLASDNEELLRKIASECRADATCRAAFDVEADMKKVESDLDAHPSVVDSGGYHLTISRGAFAEFLRSTMYSYGGTRSAPLILHLAASGDWAAIAPLFIRQRSHFYDENFPLFMTVSCSSDVRWIDPSTIASATANTLLGDYRVRRQIEACRTWGGERTPEVKLPAKVNAPILVLTGDYDVITPEHWARQLANEVSPSRVVVLANSGHFEPSKCAVDLEVEFFDKGNVDVDDSCTKTIEGKKFAANLEP